MVIDSPRGRGEYDPVDSSSVGRLERSAAASASYSFNISTKYNMLHGTVNARQKVCHLTYRRYTVCSSAMPMPNRFLLQKLNVSYYVNLRLHVLPCVAILAPLQCCSVRYVKAGTYGKG